jgi:hypothetical protein
MRESTFTSKVKDLLPPEVYALKLNLPYTAGVADCWYSGCGGDLWVEYKYLKSIPREIDLVGNKDPIITRLQQSWLMARHTEGRQVAVIVGCKGGGVLYPDLDWMELMSRAEFESRIWTRSQLAGWISGHCVGGKSLAKHI